MVAPVRWLWRNRPAASVRSSKAAPPTAGVTFVVLEGTAGGTVSLAGRRGRAPPVPWWPMAWWWPVGAFR